MENKKINFYEKLIKIIDKYYKLIFFAILILAVFLNCYRLGDVPYGIHIDEAGMTYDAYSIANYGVDRFVKHFPVYFINFGGGQNALYTYLAALVIKLVGFYNYTIIRIPALILSVLEVIISYFLVKEFKGKKQGLLFMFLVTIMPWHIMKSRWGLESYLLSPMLLFSLYSLLKAVKGKKLWQYFISGLLFGLTLYTYALSYIVIPIFLFITLIYLIKLKKINIKQIIIFGIPLFILALPLILMLMVQKGWIPEIDSFITIPKLLVNRMNEINIKNIIFNISTLKYVFAEPYLGYNGIKGFGTLYPLGLILIIIIKEIKKLALAKEEKEKQPKEIDLNVVMLFMFIANFILCFLVSLNVNKANGIYISATYFIFVALIMIKEKAKTVSIILVLLLSTFFTIFINNYFTDFARRYNPFFDNDYINTLKYVYSTELKDRKIYSDTSYIYSLYVNPISPYEFYENMKMGDIPNGQEVIGYNNYTQKIDLSNIEEDAVYITYQEDIANTIEKKGFTKEQYTIYYILYKK